MPAALQVVKTFAGKSVSHSSQGVGVGGWSDSTPTRAARFARL